MALSGKNTESAMPDVHIIALRVEHLMQIAKLEQECFAFPWSASSLSFLLAEPVLTRVAVTDKGDVVGYAGCRQVLDEGQITNVAVTQEYRGHGIGKMLMEALCQTAKDVKVATMTLDVRVSNTVARHLYTSSGFTETGTEKNAYQNPREDAVIMAKQL